MVNKNIYQIDEELIDFYKNHEKFERNKDKNNWKNVIKAENNLIEKQMKLYNENIKQFKSLNELINICDDYYINKIIKK